MSFHSSTAEIDDNSILHYSFIAESEIKTYRQLQPLNCAYAVWVLFCVNCKGSKKAPLGNVAWRITLFIFQVQIIVWFIYN